jgi:hypothetical protein
MAKSDTLLAFSAALLVNEQGHVVGHRDVRHDVPVHYTPSREHVAK